MQLHNTPQMELRPSKIGNQQPTKSNDNTQDLTFSDGHKKEKFAAPEVSTTDLRIKQFIHDATEMLNDMEHEESSSRAYKVSLSNTIKRAKYTEDVFVEVSATPHSERSHQHQTNEASQAQTAVGGGLATNSAATTLAPFPLLYKCLWGLSDPNLARDDFGIYPKMSTTHDCLVDEGGNLNVVLVNGTETHDELVQKVVETFPYRWRYSKGGNSSKAIPTLKVASAVILCKVPTWGPQEDIGDGTMGVECNDLRLVLQGKNDEEKSLIWDIVRKRESRDLVLIDLTRAENTEAYEEEDFEANFEKVNSLNDFAFD